jgi:hypothetical protein
MSIFQTSPFEFKYPTDISLCRSTVPHAHTTPWHGPTVAHDAQAKQQRGHLCPRPREFDPIRYWPSQATSNQPPNTNETRGLVGSKPHRMANEHDKPSRQEQQLRSVAPAPSPPCRLPGFYQFHIHLLRRLVPSSTCPPAPSIAHPPLGTAASKRKGPPASHRIGPN